MTVHRSPFGDIEFPVVTITQRVFDGLADADRVALKNTMSGAAPLGTPVSDTLANRLGIQSEWVTA